MPSLDTMENFNDDQITECPLCMEPFDEDDMNFYPCTCGYQICRFCWHRIRIEENELCPACRKPYSENPAKFQPLSDNEIANIKKKKKTRDQQKKSKVTESRKHLANIRVVQKNLVFVVGLSHRLADSELLKRTEYFGKYGKAVKVVVNNSTSYAGAQGPSASAYVTYARVEDALRAVQQVNNQQVDGRIVKASLGTTKYCAYFLRGQNCPKADCMYLHELGDSAASFTKEDMQAGKHLDYERNLMEEIGLKVIEANPTNGLSQTSGTSTSSSTSSQPAPVPVPSGDRGPELPPPRKAPQPLSHPASRRRGGWCQQRVTRGRSKPPRAPRHQMAQESEPFSSQAQSDLDDAPWSEMNGDYPQDSDDAHFQESYGADECMPMGVPNGHAPTHPSSHGFFPDPGQFNHHMSHHRMARKEGHYGGRLPNGHGHGHGHCPPLGSMDSNWRPPAADINWQAVFGFPVPQPPDDDLGFDPYQESRRALCESRECDESLSEWMTKSLMIGEERRTAAASHLRRMAGVEQPANLHQRVSPSPYDNSYLNGMHGQNLALEQWRSGLRALLPNVNISFGHPERHPENGADDSEATAFPWQSDPAEGTNAPVSSNSLYCHEAQIPVPPGFSKV